jgi:hypothetical protein
MAKQLTEQELRRQAVQALSDSLGPVDALRFLALVSREPFGYQKWRREYFSQYDVDQLLGEVQKHHKRKNFLGCLPYHHRVKSLFLIISMFREFSKRGSSPKRFERTPDLDPGA